MKLSKVYLPRFLTADELERPITITIQRVTFEKCYNKETRENEEKPVVWAVGAKRGFVANKTMIKALMQFFGDVDTADLQGKKIIIYPCELKNGKKTICARQSDPEPIAE